MTASPLLSTSENALSLLFESDPLTLTDAQLDSMILGLRRRRNAFFAEEAAKSLKPKSTRAKAGTVDAATSALLDKPASELSLDDLMGDA